MCLCCSVSVCPAPVLSISDAVRRDGSHICMYASRARIALEHPTAAAASGGKPDLGLGIVVYVHAVLEGFPLERWGPINQQLDLPRPHCCVFLSHT